jgi:hypothetical protein
MHLSRWKGLDKLHFDERVVLNEESVCGRHVELFYITYWCAEMQDQQLVLLDLELLRRYMDCDCQNQG